MVEKDRVSGCRPFIKYEPRGPSDTEPFRLHIPVGRIEIDSDWKAVRMNLTTLRVLVAEADVEQMKARLDDYGVEIHDSDPWGFDGETDLPAHNFDIAYDTVCEDGGSEDNEEN